MGNGPSLLTVLLSSRKDNISKNYMRRWISCRYLGQSWRGQTSEYQTTGGSNTPPLCLVMIFSRFWSSQMSKPPYPVPIPLHVLHWSSCHLNAPLLLPPLWTLFASVLLPVAQIFSSNRLSTDCSPFSASVRFINVLLNLKNPSFSYSEDPKLGVSVSVSLNKETFLANSADPSFSCWCIISDMTCYNDQTPITNCDAAYKYLNMDWLS